MSGRQRLAGQHLEAQALLGDPRALLADGLALAALERAEEVVEARVAAVVPVVLHALALEQARGGEGVPLRLAAEGDVERGDAELLGRADQAARQRRAHLRAGTRRQQQARPRHRRERHRDLQLRVVAPARALVGVRPAPVEHVLAVGVALHVHRRAAEQPPVLLDHRVQRQPAGVLAGRAAGLERGEEGVAEERLVGADAGVPRSPARARAMPWTSLTSSAPEAACRRALRRAQRSPRPRPQQRAAGSGSRLQNGHDVQPRPSPGRSGPRRR